MYNLLSHVHFSQLLQIHRHAEETEQTVRCMLQVRVCHVLRCARADRHVTAGRSGVGDASSVAPGSSGSPHGCAAVPDHGVDVQWQNTSGAHQQAEG